MSRASVYPLNLVVGDVHHQLGLREILDHKAGRTALHNGLQVTFETTIAWVTSIFSYNGMNR